MRLQDVLHAGGEEDDSLAGWLASWGSLDGICSDCSLEEAAIATVEGDLEGLVCSICIEGMAAGDLVKRLATCGHLFRPDCLENFFANTSSQRAIPLGCPNCRQLILS